VAGFQAREFVKSNGAMGQDGFQDIVDLFDVRLIAHLVQRPVSGTFKAQGEIGYAFYKEFSALAKDRSMEVGPCPKNWTAPKPVGSATTKGNEISRATDISVDDAKSLTKLTTFLETKGCIIGAECIETESPKRTLHVLEISDTSVKFRLPHGKACCRTIKIIDVERAVTFAPAASQVRALLHE
jgi:hypothetical protein